MARMMKISLIGMSGSGKSFWAKRLEALGFQRFCIDDMIEERLGEELTRLGYQGINDVARWMGQPYEAQYGSTSVRYLALEAEVLHEALEAVEKAGAAERIVVDTTGSVVYMDEDILRRLSEGTTVVHLEVPSSVLDQQYQRFLADLKPVIWGTVFSQQAGETGQEALARSYPELLASRDQHYRRLADHALPYHVVQHQSFSAEDLVDYLTALPSE